MKRYQVTLGLFLLFICHNLYASCSYPDDPSMQSAMEACRERSTKRWDCQANRCVGETVSEETGHDLREMREAFKQCQGIEDYDERRECLLALARKLAEGRNTDPDEIDNGMAPMLVNGAFLAFMLLSHGTSGDSGGGMCPSRTVMGLTGGAGLMMEYQMRQEVNTLLDNLEQEYEKRARHENPFDAQVDALEFLKMREEAIVEIAEKKKKNHLMMTIGYGASFGLATAELVSLNSGGSFGSGCGYQANSSGESDMIDASDQLDSSADLSEGLEGGGEQAGGVRSLLQSMNHPGVVMAASGIGAGLNFFLYQKADEQLKFSEENVLFLEALIETFKDAMVGYCPTGRNDMSVPECYCYTDQGDRNPNRSNSQICQNYWESRSRSLFAAGSDYDRHKSGAQAPRGCIFVTGKFDEECSCRNMEDEQGNNACLKTASISSNLGGLGNALGVGAFASDIENLASGDMNVGSLNSSDLERRAARVRDVNDQLIGQINEQREKQGLPPVDIDHQKAAANFVRNHAKEAIELAKQNDGLGLLSGTSMPDNSQLNNQLDQAASLLGQSNDSKELSGGRGLQSRRSSASSNDNGFNFDFSSGGRSGGGRVDHFGSNQNGFNYTNDDITKNQGTSIWNIISHRYNTSGLRRLFPDEH